MLDLKRQNLAFLFNERETSHRLILRFTENNTKRDCSVVILVPHAQASE